MKKWHYPQRIEDVYTPEIHHATYDVTKDAYDEFKTSENITPWLTTPEGLIRIKGHSQWPQLKTRVVSAADDQMRWRVGKHFVRHDVDLYQEAMKARTRIYPSIGRMIGIFTSSDPAWMMDYPTVKEFPVDAANILHDGLSNLDEVHIADKSIYDKLSPQGRFILRYWVGVRIGDKQLILPSRPELPPASEE
jgi:hypothetical protein